MPKINYELLGQILNREIHRDLSANREKRNKARKSGALGLANSQFLSDAIIDDDFITVVEPR